MQVWGIGTKFGGAIKKNNNNIRKRAEHMPTSGLYSSGNSWGHIRQ